MGFRGYACSILVRDLQTGQAMIFAVHAKTARMDEAEGGFASVSSQIVRMLRISEIHPADGAGA